MDAVVNGQTLDNPNTFRFLAGRMRHLLSRDDLRRIEALVTRVETVPDGAVLSQRGSSITACTILLDGFALRILRQQDERLSVGVNVPGDFLDLHGFVMERIDYDVLAAGSVRVGRIDRGALIAATDAHPGIARALWFSTLLDGAIHRRWIRTLQYLDAPKRIAHLYAELHARLTLAGYDIGRVLRTPFTQLDLASMCGVSAVHANRAIAKLRELGIADIRRGDLTTADWDRLRRYARFEGTYLYGPGEFALGQPPLPGSA